MFVSMQLVRINIVFMSENQNKVIKYALRKYVIQASIMWASTVFKYHHVNSVDWFRLII